MNCPKYVEFHSNNKFEKLVHLGSSIIQMVVLYKFIMMHGHMNVKFYNIKEITILEQNSVH
jgi:hypothetical protein